MQTNKMTSPIKFRAWDRVKKQMWPTIVEIKAVFEEGYYPCPNSEDCDFLQFTGLLDKNRKEIYEGDVLKPSDELRKEIMSSYEPDALLQVEWAKNGFYFVVAGTDGSIPTSQITGEMAEVIGNIYENPELLKS